MTTLTGGAGNCFRLDGLVSTGPLSSRDAPGSRAKDSIQIYRGDSLKIRMEIKDEFNQPVDISDTLIKVSFKYEEYCLEYKYYLRSDQGQNIEVLNAPEGLFDINIPYTDTEEWGVGWPLWYDVEITWPDAKIRKTVKKARIEVLQDISDLE